MKIILLFFILYLCPAAHCRFFLFHLFVLICICLFFPRAVSLACFLAFFSFLHLYVLLCVPAFLSLSFLPSLSIPLFCSLLLVFFILFLIVPVLFPVHLLLSLTLCAAPCSSYLLPHLSIPGFFCVPCPSLFRSTPLCGSLSSSVFYIPLSFLLSFLVPLACYPSLLFLSFSISLSRSCCSPSLSVSNGSFSISAPLPVLFLLFSLFSILPLTFCLYISIPCLSHHFLLYPPAQLAVLLFPFVLLPGLFCHPAAQCQFFILPLFVLICLSLFSPSVPLVCFLTFFPPLSPSLFLSFNFSLDPSVLLRAHHFLSLCLCSAP
ncbi:uncharacterized protein LOC142076605 [Calonectris borealis]|uniref:uncharacterized protein LOC142076605 n=1 Tax=Calonectris borealis TaxID=1323832 RepID=UPI003F4C35C4